MNKLDKSMIYIGSIALIIILSFIAYEVRQISDALQFIADTLFRKL